jgi:photosystem II stability/assembly factor-like uncharacterized protein
MAKRSSRGVSTRTSSRRRTPKKVRPTTKARRPTRLRIPEDNPSKRFQELLEDQLPGLPAGESLSKLRLAARAVARVLAPSTETNLTPATPGGSNWIELGPTAIPNGQTYGGASVIVTGRVTEIVQHPTDPLTIFVGTARGGIWKSTDGGITWTPKSDHEESLAIGALAISSSNPQILYAGTGEGDIYFYRLSFPLSSVNAEANGVGILKSADGGNTWTLLGTTIFTGACFYKMAVHPSDPNMAFAASNLGLYRTTDGGANWIQVTSGLPAISATVIACTDIVFDPASLDTAYCAFWADGIYQTTNSTAATPTWTKLAGGLPTTNLSRIALGVSPTATNNVYALIANAGDALRGFYVSADSGATWSTVAAAAAVVEVYGAFTLNVSVDISTPDIVYLSGVELYKAVRTMGMWSVTNIGGEHPPRQPCVRLASYRPPDHLCGQRWRHLQIDRRR